MEKNEEILRKVYDVFTSGNVNELDNYIDPNVKEHNMDPLLKTDKTGIDYVKEIFSTYHRAFPDLKVNIDEVFSKGDKTGAFVTFSGTHKGDMNGFPATNKKVTVNGFDMIRVQNGKIVEHWGVFDSFKMMLDLGMISEKEMAAQH